MKVLQRAAVSRTGPVRKAFHATLVLGLLATPAMLNAQTNLADEKTQAEIDKLEMEREKLRIDLIRSANSATGAGTVTSPELTAEGLLLSHYLQEQAAEEVAKRFSTWRAAAGETHSGSVAIVFGDQPPSVADYLAFDKGIERLRANLISAVQQWGDAKPAPVAGGGGHAFGPGAAIMVATTVAALLRVDTAVSGANLATPNDQFRAILLQALRAKGVPTDVPRVIAGRPGYSEHQFDSLLPQNNAATDAYREYLDLLRQKGGKLDALTEPQRLAGASLTTALADYETLRKALYTPAAGVLPAHLIDEQELLFRERAQRPVLYVHQQKAALTTTTKKGLLTGIGGIPAYVSGSMTVDYSFAGTTPAAGAVTVSSPTMRITGVRAWLNPEPEKKKPSGSE